MRRITIEFGEGPPCGFDVVDEYGRRCDGLGFDEMLGQLVSITHPQLGKPHYRMQTEEQWAAERERSRLERERRRAEPPLFEFSTHQDPA